MSYVKLYDEDGHLLKKLDRVHLTRDKEDGISWLNMTYDLELDVTYGGSCRIAELWDGERVTHLMFPCPVKLEAGETTTIGPVSA